MVLLDFPDGPEWLVVFVIVGVVAAGFVIVPQLDAQARFVATAPVDYISTTESNLTFTREQVDLLNEVSTPSLGFDAVADERLYCGTVRNGQVRNLRLADRIEASTLTSISGGCVDQFGGDVDLFIHTQPSGSSELSAEDKDVEVAVDYSCIQYAEIAVSPTGAVSGLNCWKVTGVGTDATFTSVDVGVSS